MVTGYERDMYANIDGIREAAEASAESLARIAIALEDLARVVGTR